MIKNIIYALIGLLCLAGCTPNDNTMPVPKYLTQKDIYINASEIVLNRSKSNIKVAPELVRLLDLHPFDILEDWITTKFQVNGQHGLMEIELQKLSIVEQNHSEYIGDLKLVLNFRVDGKIVKKIHTIISAVKGFHSSVSISERKRFLYALIQDLINGAHSNILYELYGN